MILTHETWYHDVHHDSLMMGCSKHEEHVFKHVIQFPVGAVIVLGVRKVTYTL